MSPPFGAREGGSMQKLKQIAAVALTGLAAGLALAAGLTAAGAQALPGDFVFLRDIDPTIRQDIRYAGSNNFVGRRLSGYDAAECVVKRARRPGAEEPSRRNWRSKNCR